MRDTHDIPREECVRLVAAGMAGRVAVTTPTGPHILPVNYSVMGESILLRTTPYSLLGTYGRDAMLCFEVDQFDYAEQRGWSVVVRGRADIVDDADEIEQIGRIWPPQPWAIGQRNLMIRIPWNEISGRQLGRGWDPLQHLPSQRHA